MFPEVAEDLTHDQSMDDNHTSMEYEVWVPLDVMQDFVAIWHTYACSTIG